MIENALMDFGTLGMFTAYLIYDRQVVMPKLIKSIDRLATLVQACPKK